VGEFVGEEENRLDIDMHPVGRLLQWLRKTSVGEASSSGRLEGGEMMLAEIEVDLIYLESSKIVSCFCPMDE
jgi:hypothetical protein